LFDWNGHGYFIAEQREPAQSVDELTNRRQHFNQWRCRLYEQHQQRADIPNHGRDGLFNFDRCSGSHKMNLTTNDWAQARPVASSGFAWISMARVMAADASSVSRFRRCWRPSSEQRYQKILPRK